MSLLITIFSLFFLCSCQVGALRKVEVLRFFDGDSFLVRDLPCNDCKSFQVRMLGIDAPEFSQKPHGEIAQKFLVDLVGKDKIVYLQYDQEKKDKYNRDLAFVFLDKDKKTFVNEEMLFNGLAELFVFKNDLQYYARLKEAQKNAKILEKGIWHPKTGLKISPYKYRKMRRAK